MVEDQNLFQIINHLSNHIVFFFSLDQYKNDKEYLCTFIIFIIKTMIQIEF